MRSIENFYSERGRDLLVPLVATAVGATASAAVILSLVGSPPPQHDVTRITNLVSLTQFLEIKARARRFHHGR
jgi:hypothetical protein